MCDGERIRPMTEEDFVRDDSGAIIGYIGPSFKLVFNPDANLKDEACDLANLGYVVGPIIQNNGTREMVVHGEIPDWIRQQYERFGVNVNQIKKRGETSPCRW